MKFLHTPSKFSFSSRFLEILSLIFTKMGKFVAVPMMSAFPVGKDEMEFKLSFVKASEDALIWSKSLGFVTLKIMWVLHWESAVVESLTGL